MFHTRIDIHVIYITVAEICALPTASRRGRLVIIGNDGGGTGCALGGIGNDNGGHDKAAQFLGGTEYSPLVMIACNVSA